MNSLGRCLGTVISIDALLVEEWGSTLALEPG